MPTCTNELTTAAYKFDTISRTVLGEDKLCMLAVWNSQAQAEEHLGRQLCLPVDLQFPKYYTLDGKWRLPATDIAFADYSHACAVMLTEVRQLHMSLVLASG